MKHPSWGQRSLREASFLGTEEPSGSTLPRDGGASSASLFVLSGPTDFGLIIPQPITSQMGLNRSLEL